MVRAEAGCSQRQVHSRLGGRKVCLWYCLLTTSHLTHQAAFLCHFATRVHGITCFWLAEVSELVGVLVLHVPEKHHDTFAPTQIYQNTAKLPNTQRT